MKTFNVQRKVGFDFLKFLYAILIFLLHYFAFSPQICGNHPLTSFYICCEGFFIISGVFLFKAAKNSQENTIIFVFKKWLGLLPYLVVGGIFYMVSQFIYFGVNNAISQNWSGIILRTFFFIVPIALFKSTYVIWFISALLIGYLIYFGFAKKFQRYFPFITLIISIFIYICIYCLYSTIDIQNLKLIQIIPFAYLRGLAGLGLGCFIEKINDIYKINIKNCKMNIFIDFIIFILISLFIFLAIWEPRTRFEIIIIVIMFFVSWMLNNNIGYINKKKWLWTKYLANFSLIFYLIHPSWIDILNLTKLTPQVYLVVLIFTSILSSIFFLFLIKWIKITFKKISTKWNSIN